MLVLPQQPVEHQSISKPGECWSGSPRATWRSPSAVAITLLNRIEYAVFGVVYFLTEVRRLLGMVAICRCRRTSAVPQGGPVSKPPVTQ
jgi:hypothetical protein